MFNKVILMGRLTRDPDLRHTQNNTSVVSFTLAVDRPYKSGSGERQTDFLPITAWGKLGDWCTNWLERGTMVIVAGTMQSRPWTDKSGNRRIAYEVKADEIRFGESRAARERAQQAAGNAPYPADANAFQELADDEDDGDVPF